MDTITGFVTKEEGKVVPTANQGFIVAFNLADKNASDYQTKEGEYKRRQGWEPAYMKVVMFTNTADEANQLKAIADDSVQRKKLVEVRGGLGIQPYEKDGKVYKNLAFRCFQLRILEKREQTTEVGAL